MQTILWTALCQNKPRATGYLDEKLWKQILKYREKN